jgi:hypothetical protein
MRISLMIPTWTEHAQKVRIIRLAIAPLLALGLLAVHSRAEQSGCTQSAVFVSVEDEMGKPVADLTAANFHASIGKDAASVIAAAKNTPLRILVLFDLSTSMHEAFVAKSTGLLALSIIQRSGPEVQFGFSTFSDRFEMKEEFTSDHQILAQRMVQDLQNSPRAGPSAVYDSALAATGAFGDPQIGDAVLMFTDGDDNMSSLNSVQAKTRIAASHVRLFSVSPPIETSTGNFKQETSGNRSRFIDMVEGSGGQIFYLGRENPSKAIRPKRIEFRVEKDFHNIADVADGILRYMATGYRLQILPAISLTKPEDWKLEIIENSGAKNAALFARYQPKLYPCSDASTRK